MKNVTKITLGVIALATAVLQTPAAQAYIVAHPSIASMVAAVVAALSLVHNPVKEST